MILFVLRSTKIQLYIFKFLTTELIKALLPCQLIIKHTVFKLKLTQITHIGLYFLNHIQFGQNKT